MLSLRSRIFVFCLSIAFLLMLKIFAFDGYARLRTKLAIHSTSNSTFESTGYKNNTLGIASKIYVLSLPARTDRRRDMEHLRKVLGLQWTYVNAINSQNAIIERIMDSVRIVRQTRPTDSVFTWPDQQVPLTERIDVWDPAFLAPSSARSSQHSHSPPLVCAAQNDTVVSYNPNLPLYQILTRARIACWHSHLSIIYTIANDFTLRQDDVVVVLEDDVDMEQDIQQRLSNVWPFLPTGWDIVYLGVSKTE
ncbi:hypothetical protein C0993_000761 [Termitomyces sp. T159_Od127]|nr:hypothetical protein C0993_000761 [Termitomyces sp. T159_Od127]